MYASPWMPNPVFNQGIPDHRTYEQRILAVLEQIRDGQQTLIQTILMARPVGEPTPAKPKGGRK